MSKTDRASDLQWWLEGQQVSYKGHTQRGERCWLCETTPVAEAGDVCEECWFGDPREERGPLDRRAGA